MRQWARWHARRLARTYRRAAAIAAVAAVAFIAGQPLWGAVAVLAALGLALARP
jgi:hypothetical protein